MLIKNIFIIIITMVTTLVTELVSFVEWFTGPRRGVKELGQATEVGK
jgi:hypothetical protein